ncbi:Holliday junction resolvase RuvX [Candidatus Bipolaricaulota bacterium]|nr:Holliday junction resolvase RuvX [Candidatus Bipolaricaulota bacterium]
MRVLGLDVGDRRIGVALSDESGTVAQGRGVYTCRGEEEDLSYFAELCRREGVEKIVVGLPLHMDGSEGEQAAKARAFGEALGARTGLPVEFLDERLTTVEANRVLREAGLGGRRRRKVRDQLSAVLILQAWLDSNRPQGPPM